MTSTKLFHLLKNESHVGTGTVIDLVKWLQTFVAIHFRENGIEYWYTTNNALRGWLKESDLVPTYEFEPNQDKQISDVVCYVTMVSNEGSKIHICFKLRSGQVVQIAAIKTFGHDEESWAIAAAVSHVLELIVHYRQVPQIVELDGLIPRHNYGRKSTLKEPVTLSTTSHSLSLVTESGIVIDECNYDEACNVLSHHFVQARMNDWLILLSSASIPVTTRCHHIETERGFDGYLFTDRGLGSGLYVLAPGDDHCNDDDYSGPYSTKEKAVEAAAVHLNFCLSMEDLHTRSLQTRTYVSKLLVA